MDLVAFGGAGAGIAVAVFSGVGGLDWFKVLFLVLIAVEFFLPLRALGSAFHVAMNGASAGKKILQLLKTPEQNWGENALGKIENIVFNDVSFGYDESRPVISGATFSLPQNSITAIVGESGSGKSTVVSLLTGALKAQKGSVALNGRDIFSYSRESYYGRLAAVSYNTYIFNDTVSNNFRLVKKDVTDGEMWDALKKVNLDGFIRESGGLDKTLSEDAANISGGQKQRLALAVNLVSGKDFYVFDEATSNIDVESEAVIIANIAALSKNAGVLVISHRLENVVNADNIFVLKDGVIAEYGKHSELLDKKGEYARLYTTQKKLESGYLGEAAVC
jgi:ABC-type transport system involved in cytochrome bd biosynthesis fused ATPase/permease subunit